MTTGRTSTGAHDADDGMSGRLDSWKDVAAYLKRDVSTVQRWEHREGLPIHRHLHDKLGSHPMSVEGVEGTSSMPGNAAARLARRNAMLKKHQPRRWRTPGPLPRAARLLAVAA